MTDTKLRFWVEKYSDGSFWIRDRLHPQMNTTNPEILHCNHEESAIVVADILNKWYATPKQERRLYA